MKTNPNAMPQKHASTPEHVRTFSVSDKIQDQLISDLGRRFQRTVEENKQKMLEEFGFAQKKN